MYGSGAGSDRHPHVLLFLGNVVPLSKLYLMLPKTTQKDGLLSFFEILKGLLEGTVHVLS